MEYNNEEYDNDENVSETNNGTLYIYLGSKGYNITTDGITPMEFSVDGENTQNIVDKDGKPDLKEAISICTRHSYGFKII